MARIVFKQIEDIVQNWAKSPSGKKEISKTIDEYMRKGVTKTDGGSKLLTSKSVDQYADELIMMLAEYAHSHDIPDSVLKHFSSLKKSAFHQLDNGSYMVEIAFTDDLSRPSLDRDNYDGVENIVAIFNNGYPADASRSAAIAKVDGFWHGKYVHALPYRQGLQFMQNAVADFNLIHKDDGGVYAELAEVYKT